VNNSDVCGWVFDQTHSPWLAAGSYYFVLKPATIAIIVIMAAVARYLIHRTINRLVRTTAERPVSGLLRARKDRAAETVTEATTTAAVPERRRQRAEAIGSVLRSFATATIYSIAGLMALSQLGLNVAPLLASAGIVGLALGFGAQTLVKDLIAGLFMLVEDQYGVGDLIDVGSASGTVEAVGLRVTTIRDGRGVVWYIRNGEIVRVGNKSQGWAVVMVDIPVAFNRVDSAVSVLRTAATSMAEDPAWQPDLIEPPEVLGVEQITVDGVMLRTSVKTPSPAQWRVGRELRRRLTEALSDADLTQPFTQGRLVVRQPVGEVNETASSGEAPAAD
jgi:small conductance mechanosensitive channel